MPRRASSGVNVGQIAGIGIAVLGFLVIAALLIKVVAGDLLGGSGSGSSGSVSSAAPLELETYRTNGNSLRGNVYRIEGRVEETLRWTPDRGRLISFEASDGIATVPVPVRVPETFSHINIERGSEMEMTVRVERDGLLIAEAIE